jgi:hypothetical protein
VERVDVALDCPWDNPQVLLMKQLLKMLQGKRG